MQKKSSSKGNSERMGSKRFKKERGAVLPKTVRKRDRLLQRLTSGRVWSSLRQNRFKGQGMSVMDVLLQEGGARLPCVTGKTGTWKAMPGVAGDASCAAPSRPIPLPVWTPGDTIAARPAMQRFWIRSTGCRSTRSTPGIACTETILRTRVTAGSCQNSQIHCWEGCRRRQRDWTMDVARGRPLPACCVSQGTMCGSLTRFFRPNLSRLETATISSSVQR